MNKSNEILAFSGNATQLLANKICDQLNIPMGKAFIGKFADSETRVEIESNVRGRDVFIIQSTSAPANENLMELLLVADALKRSSAHSITAVIPYYGYGRQERKSAPRTPISAKLVADLLVTAGVNRLLTLELHASAVQGFFNIPVDHLFSKPIFFNHLKTLDLNDAMIVSPDAGGVERARALAKVMNCGLAIVDKRRDKPGVSQVMHVIGDVKDKTAILLDDICDTAGTLTQAADALTDRGARQVFAAITHPIFSGPALERIEKSSIKEIFVTDTIPLSAEAQGLKKIKVLTVSKLLAEAMLRIHNSDSISSLFI